jgi:hypothetical protein
MSAPLAVTLAAPESGCSGVKAFEKKAASTLRLDRARGLKSSVDRLRAGAYKPAPSPRRGSFFDMVNLWGRDARAAALGRRELVSILDECEFVMCPGSSRTVMVLG